MRNRNTIGIWDSPSEAQIIQSESDRATRAALASMRRSVTAARNACDFPRWLHHHPAATTGAVVLAGVAVTGVVVRALRADPARDAAYRKPSMIMNLAGKMMGLAFGMIRGAVLSRFLAGGNDGSAVALTTTGAD